MKLNFRQYKFSIKEVQGNALIFDIIRKKYIRLTPEEWVRQHLVHYLSEDLGVPRGLMSLEREISFNNLKKRFDICVFSSSGQALMLVECKAPSVELNRETMMQAGVYNKTMGVRFILLSNGEQNLLFKWNETALAFEPQAEIPPYRDWF